MTYMQEIGIVHRDLKSANVLLESVPLNETSSMLKAVVCDFGLAKVTHSATTLENMKFKDIGGFSPRYAAPEVFANSHLLISTDPEVDKKSDVYSFGIVLWEMATRLTPWKGLNREQIETAVRSGQRVSLSLSRLTWCAFLIFLSFSLVVARDSP